MALMMSMIGLKFMRRTSKCNGFNSKKTLLTTTSTITVGYSQYTPLLGGRVRKGYKRLEHHRGGGGVQINFNIGNFLAGTMSLLLI